MKDNGKKIKCQDKELTTMQMDQSIKAAGKPINTLDKEYTSFQMAQFTRDNGKIISWMVLAISSTALAVNGEDSFEKVNFKVKIKQNS